MANWSKKYTEILDRIKPVTNTLSQAVSRSRESARDIKDLGTPIERPADLSALTRRLVQNVPSRNISIPRAGIASKPVFTPPKTFNTRDIAKRTVKAVAPQAYRGEIEAEDAAKLGITPKAYQRAIFGEGDPKVLSGVSKSQTDLLVGSLEFGSIGILGKTEAVAGRQLRRLAGDTDIVKQGLRELSGGVGVKANQQYDDLAEELFKEYGVKIKPKIKREMSALGKLEHLSKELNKRWDDVSGGVVANKPFQQTGFMGGKVPPTKVEEILQQGRRTGKLGQPAKALGGRLKGVGQQLESQAGQTGRKLSSQDQEALDNIISQGRDMIGRASREDKRPIKKVLDDLYTQWVDRYNPISIASKKAQQVGGKIASKDDPTYLVRRLTGAGGIADLRFKEQLNPVLKQIEKLGIGRGDMDAYLANMRIAGFGDIGREIKGADPAKASRIVEALEIKYGNEIKEVAEQLYKYQDEGLQQLADAGFLADEAVAAIRSRNPNYAPLYRVMDEVDDYLGLPTRKTQQAVSPVKEIKGSKRKILSPLESIIGDTFSQRAAIEKNRVAQSIIALQDVADLGFKQVSKESNETLAVWRGGKREYWNVGRDIADVANATNEEAMNTVLKLIRAPAAILRQGATGRNPEFMIPNVVRDQLDAAVTSKYGYVPFVDYVRGLSSIIKNDEMYKAWQNSGAKIDLGELSGQKTMQALFDEKKAKRGLFGWISSVLDVAGKYSEQPTRVGLYKKAYKKTKDPLIAMLESRDATVDFARMGSKMKVANSLIPFLNVGVQGFNKIIRRTKEDPLQVLLKGAVYGAAPAATITMYNLMRDPEAYAEIPTYEKDNNFVLIKGRNRDGTVDYITIPKGNVLPVISNPVQSFIEFVHSQDKSQFDDMALTMFSDVLPVIGEGSTAKQIAVSTIGGNLPQAVKPITENLINKSFFRYSAEKDEAREVVPYYLKDKPAYKQDYEFTPQMYKTVGALLNVSPLQVKNLLEGYFAGYSKIPAQVIQAVYNISEGKSVPVNERTILRRFFKQTYPTSESKKKAEEKPKAPGLMERITPEAGAAEESPEDLEEREKHLMEVFRDSKSTQKAGFVGKKLIWVDKKDNKQSVDFSDYGEGDVGLEKFGKETTKYADARKVYKSPANENIKAKVFKDLGLNEDDVGYDVASYYTTAAKTAYFTQLAQSGDRETFLTELVNGRKQSVSGKYLANEGTLTELRDAGLLSYDEWKELKNLKIDNTGRDISKTSSTSTKKGKLPAKAKLPAAPKAKKVTFSDTGKVKIVKAKRPKRYKLNKIDTKSLSE